MVWPVFGVGQHHKVVKGEDYILVQEQVEWEWPVGLERTPEAFSVYAVFDGHGGKNAAEQCRKTFVNELKAACTQVAEEAMGAEKPLGSWEDGVLPKALSVAFLKLDVDLGQQDDSGTTATVAVVMHKSCSAGEDWVHVSVANVGDSHVYAEHCDRVRRLNEDHRLDSNKVEVSRLLAVGAEVERKSSSHPLRLWPGGLMMSRTLGDVGAVHAKGDPAVRSFVFRLTMSDGSFAPCRLVVASDGLWDVMAAKKVMTSVRKKVAGQAANSICSEAVKVANATNNRDDLSVIVVDLAASDLQNARGRLLSTCSLASAASKASMGQAASKSFYSWRPLEEEPPYQEIHEKEAILAEERRIAQEHAEALELARAAEAQAAELERQKQLELDLAAVKEAAEKAGISEGIAALALGVSGVAELSTSALGVEEDDGAWETVPIRKRNPAKTDSINKKNDVSDNTSDSPEEDLTPDQPAEDNPGNNTDASKNTKRDKGRKPCFKFQRGSCKQGKDCRYSHDEELSASENGSNAADPVALEKEQTKKRTKKKLDKACLSFAKGQCKRGERCIFQHENISESATLVSRDPLAQSDKKPQPVKPLQKPCFKFQKGACQRGEECKYRHDSNVQDRKGKTAGSMDNRKLKPCLKMKQGKCKFGDSCRYSHAMEDEGQSQPILPQKIKKKPAESKAYQLFVAGLDASVKVDDIREYFGRYGQVSLADKKRTFAFVAFQNPSDAATVLASELSHAISGKTISVAAYTN